MAELKTQPTDASVDEFITGVPDDRRRADAEVVLTLLAEVTGDTPQMWGPSIVGFGRYTYVGSNKKPAEWPIIGFSPRKASLTLYIMPGFAERADLIADLGKFTTSASCLYVKRLSDIDLDRLRALCTWSVETMRARYPAP